MQTALTLIISGFVASSVLAAPSLPRDLTGAVVAISSASIEGCATGFFLGDGRLITNSHVVDVLCPGGVCADILLRQSSTVGAEPRTAVSHGDVTVEQRLTALDLAVLSVKPGNGPLPISLFKLGPPTQSVQKISMLGFPNCAKLALSDGQVTEVSPLFYKTSAVGDYGNSGSPIFTEDYTVVGVARQAGSISEALSSWISSSGFTFKAINADILNTIVSKDASGVIRAQAELLERQYREYIVKLVGISRIYSGLEFSASVEGLKNEIRVSPLAAKYATILMPLGDYPLRALLPRLETDELGKALRRLVFISNLEYKGYFGGALAPLNPEAISPSLANAGYPQSESDDFAKLAINLMIQRYLGSLLGIAFYGAYAVGLSWLFLILFAGSLGYVFAREKGSFKRRLFVTILVAILFWPVSVMIYLVRQAKLNRAAVKELPKRETALQAKKKARK